MHQPCALASQLAEGFGHRADKITRECAGELAFDACRVREWAKDVEHSAASKLLPHGHDVFDRRMVHWGHHEGDAAFIKGALHDFGADHDVDAHLGLNIRGAGFRA